MKETKKAGVIRQMKLAEKVKYKDTFDILHCFFKCMDAIYKNKIQLP
jgi:hypothetical protein